MKTIFIDRDGVINRNAAEHDYIKTLSEFEFLPNSKRAILDLSEAGHQMFIVSNQAGINKGIIKREDFKEIDDYINRELRDSITKIYYCPHKLEENCNCRKPKPGMLLQAAKEYDLILSDCYYIGDAEEDVEIAKRAGCKIIFVLSGRGLDQIKKIPTWDYKPDVIAKNLYEASRLIVGGKI
jgi:D-glycero-D-manno-heptose 1,7-bisphosphate phosphatase